MQASKRRDWINKTTGTPIRHHNQNLKVSIGQEMIFNKERISTTNHGHNNETNGNPQDNQRIEVRLGTPTRKDNNQDKKEMLTETKINNQTRRIAEHAIIAENQDIYPKTVEAHQCSQQQLL